MYFYFVYEDNHYGENGVYDCGLMLNVSASTAYQTAVEAGVDLIHSYASLEEMVEEEADFYDTDVDEIAAEHIIVQLYEIDPAILNEYSAVELEEIFCKEGPVEFIDRFNLKEAKVF